LTDTVLSWKPQALPEPWIIVPTNMRASLEAELRAEMAPGHVLSSSQILTAVARCKGAMTSYSVLRVTTRYGSLWSI
jgi:hypothetical protein